MSECRRCPCGGHYDDRTVEVRLPGNGDAVVLSDVRQRACPLCGGRVYPVETLERIESVHRREPVELWIRRLSEPRQPAGR